MKSEHINDLWPDCIYCKFISNIEKTVCLKYPIFELPTLYRVHTDRKCCSSFISENTKYNTIHFKNMQEAILYFYNSQNPMILFEDIDL